MTTIIAYEYDVLIKATTKQVPTALNVKAVPARMFDWLYTEAIRLSEAGEVAWLSLSQCSGKPAVKLSQHVGVIRSSHGYQLEILPKIGKAHTAHDNKTRQLLVEMLRCLEGFKFLKAERAMLAAANMPLLEVLIQEFLSSVEYLVKRGIQKDYRPQQENLFVLRGKLQFSEHLRNNIVRRDRFYTEYDEFTVNRPANRLLRSALAQVLEWSSHNNNQKRARELTFVFSEVPASRSVRTDFQRLRIDRSMGHYKEAIAWARLILNRESPLTGQGGHSSLSLLFPMQDVFEAYVAKHLRRQLKQGWKLVTQTRSKSLVKHNGKSLFRLKPDLMIQRHGKHHSVLDTKWKLLDAAQGDTRNKYKISQADTYQLFAYGKHYLNGEGDVILIYPKTETFQAPLPVFEFSDNPALKLWVVPFCFNTKKVMFPEASRHCRAY